MRFEIEITSGDTQQTYTVNDETHDDTAVYAAITALQTFKDHGHAKFPYNGEDLTLTVTEVGLDDQERGRLR